MRNGKWNEKAKERNTYMAADCEGSQSPPRAVELRKTQKSIHHATVMCTEFRGKTTLSLGSCP
jgi:hypothetical protein